MLLQLDDEDLNAYAQIEGETLTEIETEIQKKRIKDRNRQRT